MFAITEDEERVTPADLVCFATGYHINFPMLDKSVINVNHETNQVDLYKQIFIPTLKHPETLALMGVIQPNAALFSMYEMQGRWVAALVAGKCQKLPSKAQMLIDIAAATDARKKNYYTSPRTSIEVDWMSYMDDLATQLGVMPNIWSYLLSDPLLFERLMFGTLLAYHYRLEGNHEWDGARQAIMEADERIEYAIMPPFMREKDKSWSLSSIMFYGAIIIILFYLLLAIF